VASTIEDQKAERNLDLKRSFAELALSKAGTALAAVIRAPCGRFTNKVGLAGPSRGREMHGDARREAPHRTARSAQKTFVYGTEAL
jgi:hypothetical protein